MRLDINVAVLLFIPFILKLCMVKKCVLTNFVFHCPLTLRQVCKTSSCALYLFYPVQWSIWLA
jgi:hypothetical protein